MEKQEPQTCDEPWGCDCGLPSKEEVQLDGAVSHHMSCKFKGSDVVICPNAAPKEGCECSKEVNVRICHDHWAFKKEVQDCDHDYNNPIRIGRANLRCRKCDKDITLELVIMQEARQTTPSDSWEDEFENGPRTWLQIKDWIRVKKLLWETKESIGCSEHEKIGRTLALQEAASAVRVMKRKCDNYDCASPQCPILIQNEALEDEARDIEKLTT